jgi:hypothetical protein
MLFYHLCFYIANVSIFYSNILNNHRLIIFYLLEQELIRTNNWSSFVYIVSSDVHNWNAPERADILVIRIIILNT